VIADAGYGGEENYAYLEEEQVEALVKYNTYHKEKSKVWQQDISRIDNWQYIEPEDAWVCAAGQKLGFVRQNKEQTESGYEIEYRQYRSTSCEDCPLKSKCTKGSHRPKEKGSCPGITLFNCPFLVNLRTRLLTLKIFNYF
jgi:hypothetical protein